MPAKGYIAITDQCRNLDPCLLNDGLEMIEICLIEIYCGENRTPVPECESVNRP